MPNRSRAWNEQKPNSTTGDPRGVGEIVSAYSIGSSWQEKVRRSGTPPYGTQRESTMVNVFDPGQSVRPGSVRPAKRAWRIGRFGGIPPSTWLASEPTEHKEFGECSDCSLAPSSNPERYPVNSHGAVGGRSSGRQLGFRRDRAGFLFRMEGKTEGHAPDAAIGWICGAAVRPCSQWMGQTCGWTEQRW